MLSLKLLSPSIRRNKFQGCLAGALLGDCLGAPFEQECYEDGVDADEINRLITEVAGRPPGVLGNLCYTDDTAMTKCLASSLLEKRTVNTDDIAVRFTEEYYKSPDRGYGANVVNIFKKWKKQHFADVLKVAQEQFGGRGSYGNGGAMRIAPVALFYHQANSIQVAEAAIETAKVTHSNSRGYNGACLQALAVWHALRLDPEDNFDAVHFIDFLLQEIKPREIPHDELDSAVNIDSSPFTVKLMTMKELLLKENICKKGVIKSLGTSIAAHDAVPAAIFSFISTAMKLSPSFDPGVLSCIRYAISLGGDTDTIASMAGAIAGAFYGFDGIQIQIFNACESAEETISLADQLYHASSGCKENEESTSEKSVV